VCACFPHTISAALQDVRPGKARVIKCLMENMAQPNFGEECRAELAKRQQVVKNDYR
jgi:Golgi apparatus protein 1